MTTAERKALAAYMTSIADALMSDMTSEQQNYLTGYASAHMAGLAGLLKVSNGSDLSKSITKDREMFLAYFTQLINGGK